MEPSTDAVVSVADTDRQTLAQMEAIEQQIKENQQLTSDLSDLSVLQAKYKDDGTHFREGVEVLIKNYSKMRMVRGDGNCYYRAFLYSLLERLPSQKTEAERICKWIKNESWEKILASGYDEMTLEIFYDAMVDLVERVMEEKLDANALHQEMNQENGTSDYCTWYMRVLTATHLKGDPGRFLPFIEQPGMDIEQFCQREVEPMGKECEMLQALALAEAFGLQVKIEYLDGHALQDGKLSQHVVGIEGSPIQLYLLYRPGHYDILYPSTQLS